VLLVAPSVGQAGELSLESGHAGLKFVVEVLERLREPAQVRRINDSFRHELPLGSRTARPLRTGEHTATGRRLRRLCSVTNQRRPVNNAVAPLADPASGSIMVSIHAINFSEAGSMPSSCLITGATGFVGGHVAEACVARGIRVRALVRAGSDTKLLEKLGVTLHRGDLADPATIRPAVEGVESIVHCAAKVGDWGPVSDYRVVNVEALRQLLDVCKGRPLQRFVHLSSLGVYAARHHYGTDENEPLPAQHMDGYTQTKVEAERLALDYQRQQGIPVVVLRPGFVYGPRDRAVLPKLIDNLRKRRVRFIAGGRGAMNTIYVSNLVDAVFLALHKPNAIGQVYNLTDGEFVSKRGFINALVNGLDLPKPPPVSAPLWLARLLAYVMERRARRRNSPKPPLLTQARLKFLGLNLDFSIDKAKRELGYQPRVTFEQGIEQTIAWYRQNA
jgi:nucleoside-diphosphate-sugar epimerase